jgi:hypothetical protein
MAENEKVSYRPAIQHVDDEQRRVAEDTMAVPEHRDCLARYPDGYPSPAQEVVH